jgi:uncharacterized protein (UPF0548 family)
MRNYLKLLVKVVLVTAGFALSAFAALMISTLTVQSGVHPDEWKTTAWDVAAVILVAIIYIAVLARMLYNFQRAKQRGAA